MRSFTFCNNLFRPKFSILVVPSLLELKSFTKSSFNENYISYPFKNAIKHYDMIFWINNHKILKSTPNLAIFCQENADIIKKFVKNF